MSFDKDTRNLLAKTVAACRRRLAGDVTDQLRGVFGLHPDGVVLPLEKLTHLSPDQHAAARRLRDLLDHYTAGAAGQDSDRRKAAYERMVLEISFTALNRLAALRLCEERGLVVECVRKGTTSAGFQMFERISGGALGGRYDTYRVFLECMFDELALDLGVLFDRMTPQSAVFPSERCMEDVLAELNKPELTHLWTEDETIGWVYQYFNPPEERKAMRDASQAPRNSRELAVRNQFFTPRYVVEFLTDNTLGRIWYEMRKGDTILKDGCRYLVRRPNEVFLGPGEKAPAEKDDETDLSQEELLKRPVYIEHRPKKDPRDLRILDPACGSGHFLLYAFDLLGQIYEEAWGDPDSPKSEATGRTIQEDFETIDDLRREIPKLIVEHNLHGIDIDPRAVQIAALALWLRAQKTWKNLGLKAPERPRIARSSIVTAEPMPGEEDMRREFTAGLKPRVLGQIVDEVFEKMKLAGEAGSLLKIEEEIKDAVAAAGKQWREGPKPEQQLLFPDMEARRPKQQELRFDVKGITDVRFWEQAEDRILDALKEYAEQAENGRAVRRRLFAEDTARGFAFIDLCRKRYDVVLMNPPFGEFSKPYKTYARIVYPNSYNDILGAFVERWLLCLEDHGRLGAITSRTCFYLVSFTDWREKVVLAEAALAAVADLGQGVMDDAMVEAAAYILERSRPTAVIPFIRSIAERDRQAVVGCCISAINTAASEPHLFLARQDTFRKLAGAPFVYWTKSDDLDRFSALPTFEPEAAEVRQGLATGDDPRFVRAVWEVAEKDTQFVYYPTNGETHCRLNEPIVLAYQQRRKAGTPRWAFHVKSGASQPWYSPITLKIDWHQDGSQLRNFRDAQGKLRSRPQNIAYYYRPGFSWTRRAARIYPYVIPGNCIPSVSRYMAFPEQGMDFDTLGVSASRIASAFMRFYAEFWQRPNYLVENLKMLPWPELRDNARQFFRRLIQQEVEQRQRAYMNHEPFQEFLLPIKVKDFSNGGRSLAFDPKTLLGEEGERLVADAYGFDQKAAMRIERDVIEALEYQHGIAISAENEEGENGEQDTDEDTDFVLDYSERAQIEALLSYFVGCIFGRWDARIAIDPSLAPKLPDPFDPLPVCPPGMLVGPDGLPAEPNRIVSEEWLRARPNANTLPPDGSVKNPTIPDSEYPLRISWDGVLVDDPGFNGDRPHRDDMVRRVREVFDLLWKDKSHEIEQEACDILGVSDLRDYFRRPAGFFQDHLKRYSKSRRKAPIYWPLSTASGSYTIWLYYHRLNEQTLYMVVNKYMEPKISEVERGIAQIENELKAASGREATRLTDRLNEARAFLGELRDLREELLRIAALPYKPDLNDGVIINGAPLHKLFRLRSWAKDTEDCWKKLEKGDYDWAHLAYTIWPERVREVCKRDRSIAIAHGLEDLCEVEAPESKKKGGRGRRKKEAAR